MASIMVIHGIDSQEQLLACRVCLATDTKLFHLPKHPIAETYALLTGAELSLTDGLPQHICTVCSSLLLKYAALRAKCWTANIILQVACAENHLITTDYLRNLDRKHLKHNLLSTNTQNIDIFPKNPENFTRETNSSFTQQIDLTVDDDEENYLPEDKKILDCDENNDQIFTETINCVDNKFECTAENIDYTFDDDNDNSSDDNGESLLPDCLIGIAKDVFIDSKENFTKIKTEILDTNLHSKSKEKDNIISKTNSKTKSVNIKTYKRKVKTDIKPKVETKVEEIEKNNVEIIQINNKNATNDNKNKKRVRIIKRDKQAWKIPEISKKYNVDIVILSREEQRKRIEARKETENYKNSQFQCQYCFMGFSEECKFKRHMAVHDLTDQKYICDVCHRHFSKRKHLTAHISYHHSMSLICKDCNHVSKTVTDASYHFDSHKGVTFKCEHCKKIFYKIKSKINHCRTHHGSTACTICGGAFTGQSGLRTHMIKAHQEAVDAVCSTCNLQFHSADALRKHVCEPGALPCAQCGDNFPDEAALKDHQQVHRRKRTYKHLVGKEVQCLICDATFSSLRTHNVHMHRVHKVRSAVKRSIPFYMCEMCGTRTAASKTAIAEHQRIHTGEKPYQCDYCNKKFRIKACLQIHLPTHTNERPYKCPDCPKTFKSSAGKWRHALVHNKRRPHTCQLCSKTFQTSTSMKLHIRTVHLKEPWPRRIRPSRKKNK